MELIDNALLNNYFNWLNANGGAFPTINDMLVNQDAALGIYQNWINHNGSFPANITPIEKHPYINIYPVNFNRKKLVIGTMPPIDYMTSQIGLPMIANPVGNNKSQPHVDFFHGNMLPLWDFSADAILTTALSNYRLNNINRVNLLANAQTYLTRNSISITDVIISCQRNSIDADDDFSNIDLNVPLIDELCNTDHNIEILIFTNSGTNGVEGIKIYQNGVRNGQINISKQDAFSLFLRACQINGVNIEIQLHGTVEWQSIAVFNILCLKANTRNKILFRLRLSTNNNQIREFTIITLPSPSGNARRGLLNNKIYQDYTMLNPGGSVDAYRRDAWYNALVTDNHAILATWQENMH
jgi:hypothetical protein